MTGIIARLLKVLRSVLSRFGFASAPSSTPDKDEPGVRRSAPPPSSSEAAEALPRELVEGGTAQTLQESKGDGSVESVHVQGDGDVRKAEMDSEAVGTETAVASVRQTQPMQDEDAAAGCGAASEEAAGEGIGSVAPTRDEHVQAERTPRVADRVTEHDPTGYELQTEDVLSPVGESPRNDETNDASAERNHAGSRDDTTCSTPREEISYEASAAATVLDRGTFDGSKDENGSTHPEVVGVDDGALDPKPVEEDARQIDEALTRSDPRPSPAVQPEPITDILSAGAYERGASGADVSSTSPASMPYEDPCGRGESLEERVTAAVGVSASDSGCADELPLGEEDLEGTEGDTRVPSPRRPTPPEDAREYVVAVQDVSTVDREYARWNNVVVEQLLLSRSSSEEAYLCVNPRILARVFEEGGLGLLTSEQAEQQFSTAVANVYRRRVLGHSARLRVLRRCSGGYPDCAAFLACSVLAAFRMQADEELSGNAYYRRLAVLLGCETQGVHPIGFDPPVFESLWVFLQNWLREVHGRQLALPKGDVGFRRFVALPLAHVPLRSLDIEKLPAFFSWADYQPGGRVRHDRLLADLKRWQQSRNMLTPAGAAALYDDRSSAVLAQASAELESWDGSICESASRRSALVEIQFDVVQRNPVFFYLPRRPPGFPQVFDDGERVFEASDEGWYDPAQIRPEDGEQLESGFEWLSHSSGIHFTLRRPEAVVVPLTPSSSCSGFLSSRRLLRGVRCSVLCQEKALPTVKEYLSEVAQSPLSPVSHPLLPNGWSMFRDFSARVHVEAPTGLEALDVDPNVELIVAGGLRIGRRWSWVAGAPPRILVSGLETQDRVSVNGTSVEVSANGELLTDEVIAEPGEYLIEAGSARRRIEIASPQVSVRSEGEQHQLLDGRNRKIALPLGSWTLIGRYPDQISHSRGEFFRGTIASCPFQPSWAVQVGAGPGAVVAVSTCPRPPQSVSLQMLTGQTRKMVEWWSGIIYEVHIRRPRFIGLNGAVPNASVVDVWRQYTALAKQIKRRLKRPR